MLKWIQSIVTKNLVIYLITIAVCFKMWGLYVTYNANHSNYICNDKGVLFESASPDSNVFIKRKYEVCINGDKNE